MRYAAPVGISSGVRFDRNYGASRRVAPNSPASAASIIHTADGSGTVTLSSPSVVQPRIPDQTGFQARQVDTTSEGAGDGGRIQ